MVRFGFPAFQKFVNMQPTSADLVSFKPRSSWDGWFAIAIFPEGEKLSWIKAHLFARWCRSGMHPLASFEGMDARSELMIACASNEGINVETCDIDASGLASHASPLKVELPGIFHFKGAGRDYRMSFKMPGSGMQAQFDFAAGWPIWWSKWGGILHYIGQHSSVKASLTDADGGYELKGLGVMEHVCGWSLPFDITKVMPVHYHWDVLSFISNDSPFDSAAGLSIGFRGRSLLGIRAAAKFPGMNQKTMKGLHVEYLEVADDQDGIGRPIGRPVMWRGLMESSDGVFTYTAVGSTPLLKNIPGGGMQGFSFEGEFKQPKGKILSLKGRGFSEYGDFAKNLVGIS